MEKFVIKNADGSEQNVIPAVHNSHKSAREAILNYMKDNIALMGDKIDCNFIIESELIDINEYITDFEKAKMCLNQRDFCRIEYLGNTTNDLINLNHLDALFALNKLFTIAEAWNKEDGFVPDFSDLEQGKWFPWFVYDKDAAGFVFAYAYYTATSANAYFGSRLCFKSSARAEQFGKQFIDLFNKVFL